MTGMTRLLTAGLLTLALGVSGCMGKQQPERSVEPKEQKEEKGGDTTDQADPIEEGATQMQSKLAGLKEALEVGDPNKIQDQARAFDATWESFEAKVERKTPEMYARVETSHHLILAGVQLIPLDRNVVMAEIDRLERKLEELKQTKGERQDLQRVDTRIGAAAMRQGLAELKLVVDAGDTAKMQEKVKLVDQSWARFKAEVKAQHKEAYAAIEDSFHTIVAKVGAWPVDKNALNQQIDKLDDQLVHLVH